MRSASVLVINWPGPSGSAAKAGRPNDAVRISPKAIGLIVRSFGFRRKDIGPSRKSFPPKMKNGSNLGRFAESTLGQSEDFLDAEAARHHRNRNREGARVPPDQGRDERPRA